MFQNRNFASQTLTNAGVIYLNPQHNLQDVFEGSIQFTAKGTGVSGSFSASCQLQGSNSADFSTGVVNLGSAVVLSDGVIGSIPLSGNSLNFAYYRVAITGSGTQSTTVIGTYTAKGRA